MIYGIIPARIGSKRLKEKNIVSVLGKPMICWTIDAALGSKYLNKDNLFVSTESEKIKNICKNVNIIDRPKELSGDKVWTQDVINHFIEVKNIKDEDIIVILQANSPEVDSKTIDKCIDKLINNSLWQVHTVDENMINNGAIHVYFSEIKHHKGKVNYNGYVKTDWIDVHYRKDVEEVEKKMLKKGESCE